MGRGAESMHWPAGSSVLLTTAVGLTTGISAKAHQKHSHLTGYVHILTFQVRSK